MWIRCPRCLEVISIPAERFQEVARSIDCPLRYDLLDSEDGLRLLDQAIVDIYESELQVACPSAECDGRSFMVSIGTLQDVVV